MLTLSHRLELLNITGTVYTIGKSRTTAMDAGQHATTMVSNQILLREETGTAHRFQWTGRQMSCAVDQVLTVIAAVMPAAPAVKFIAVVNHSTREVFYQERTISLLSTPNLLLYGLTAAITFMLSVQLYTDWWIPTMVISMLLVPHFYWLHARNKSHIKFIVNKLIKEIL